MASARFEVATEWEATVSLCCCKRPNGQRDSESILKLRLRWQCEHTTSEDESGSCGLIGAVPWGCSGRATLRRGQCDIRGFHSNATGNASQQWKQTFLPTSCIPLLTPNVKNAQVLFHDGSLLHSKFNTQLLITVSNFSRIPAHVQLLLVL
jgi:hypothetical protein